MECRRVVIIYLFLNLRENIYTSDSCAIIIIIIAIRNVRFYTSPRVYRSVYYNTCTIKMIRYYIHYRVRPLRFNTSCTGGKLTAMGFIPNERMAPWHLLSRSLYTTGSKFETTVCILMRVYLYNYLILYPLYRTRDQTRRFHDRHYI